MVQAYRISCPEYFQERSLERCEAKRFQMLFEENWQDHHSKLVSNWMVAEFLLPPKSVCRSKFIEGCLKSGRGKNALIKMPVCFV